MLERSLGVSFEDEESKGSVVSFLFGTPREFVAGAPAGTKQLAMSVREGVQRSLDGEELSPAEIDAYVADFDELTAKTRRRCAKVLDEG